MGSERMPNLQPFFEALRHLDEAIELLPWESVGDVPSEVSEPLELTLEQWGKQLPKAAETLKAAWDMIDILAGIVDMVESGKVVVVPDPSESN